MKVSEFRARVDKMTQDYADDLAILEQEEESSQMKDEFLAEQYKIFQFELGDITARERDLEIAVQNVPDSVDADLRESCELQQLAVDSAEHMLQERRAAHGEAMATMNARIEFLRKECAKLEKQLSAPAPAPPSRQTTQAKLAQPKSTTPKTFGTKRISRLTKIPKKSIGNTTRFDLCFLCIVNFCVARLRLTPHSRRGKGGPKSGTRPDTPPEKVSETIEANNGKVADEFDFEEANFDARDFREDIASLPMVRFKFEND